jgi:hypothetical protein
MTRAGTRGSRWRPIEVGAPGVESQAVEAWVTQEGWRSRGRGGRRRRERGARGGLGRRDVGVGGAGEGEDGRSRRETTAGSASPRSIQACQNSTEVPPICAFCHGAGAQARDALGDLLELVDVGQR